MKTDHWAIEPRHALKFVEYDNFSGILHRGCMTKSAILSLFNKWIIKQVHFDNEFLFESSIRYLMSESSERVRYRAEEYKLYRVGIELNTRREVSYL